MDNRSKKKLTNADLDVIFSNSNIVRIGNYKNAKVKTLLKCNICKSEWLATIRAVRKRISIGQTGCLRCDGYIPITNEIIDERLIGRNIIRLDNYVDAFAHMNWKCINNNCNNIWSASYDNIINGETGCRVCSNKILYSNERIDFSIKNREIYRIGNCINGQTPIDFGCRKCNYIWPAAPVCVIWGGTGCSSCAGNIQLTNEIVDERLKNYNIKRVGSYINNSTNIEWLCLDNKCNYMWKKDPGWIFNNPYCPLCKDSSNQNLIGTILLKYGILAEREKTIKKFVNNNTDRFRVDYFIPEIYLSIEYDGDGHFRPVCFGGISIEKATNLFIERQERDLYVENLHKINKVHLIRIDGRKYKWKKLEKYLIEEIIPSIQKLIEEKRSDDRYVKIQDLSYIFLI